MINRSKIIGAAAATLLVLGAASSAQAGTVKANEALGIDLGDVSGIAYYTPETRGYHVVVTLASEASSGPVRFEAVLAADQSVTVSAPRTTSLPARTIALTRKGDAIVVTSDHVAVSAY